MTRSKEKNLSRRHKPGTAPGTLIAPEGSPFPKMHLMAWNEDDLVEQAITRPDDIIPFLKKWPVIWLDVEGLGSADVIGRLGEILKIHPLALEDVLGLHQRPKTEDYGDRLFLVTSLATIQNGQLDFEQISLLVGKRFVVSFQEKPGSSLDAVRERVRFGKGRRIRFSNADYLAYAIIDAIVDGYFPVLEHYSGRLNLLEDALVAQPGQAQMVEIHHIKRDLRQLRHLLWPMREMVDDYAEDVEVVREETKPYLRDCHDHIIQVLDMLETYRERSSGLVEIYLTSVTNRTNEVMRVLTIISTIFIPLSFIASVYGMNFDPDSSPLNMPELRWFFGYPFALFLMAAVAAGLVVWFWNKGWLKKNEPL